MLDFNKNYYDEICGNPPTRNTRFDGKPGKDESDYIGDSIPKTFRIEDSDCDQKRYGPCSIKGAKTRIKSL